MSQTFRYFIAIPSPPPHAFLHTIAVSWGRKRFLSVSLLIPGCMSFHFHSYSCLLFPFLFTIVVLPIPSFLHYKSSPSLPGFFSSSSLYLSPIVFLLCSWKLRLHTVFILHHPSLRHHKLIISNDRTGNKFVLFPLRIAIPNCLFSTKFLTHFPVHFTLCVLSKLESNGRDRDTLLSSFSYSSSLNYFTPDFSIRLTIVVTVQ